LLQLELGFVTVVVGRLKLVVVVVVAVVGLVLLIWRNDTRGVTLFCSTTSSQPR
jgi:hypothetical protein